MRLSNQLSNDPTGREGMTVDAGGRLRQGQAPNAAGWRGTDLASRLFTVTNGATDIALDLDSRRSFDRAHYLCKQGSVTGTTRITKRLPVRLGPRPGRFLSAGRGRCDRQISARS